MKLKPEIMSTILDSAESLFSEQGYAPVSLESVADKASVSKRTLYKYFGDKNRLIAQVLIRRDAFFKESLSNLLTVFSDRIDKINAIISWHIQWFNREHYHGCMFIRALSEYQNKSEEINAIIKEHKQWMKHIICQSLGDNQASKDVSHLIMLILEGMISYTYLFGTENNDFSLEKKYIFELINRIDDNQS